jgi:lambda repressor-like predicted transcriptional regulator
MIAPEIREAIVALRAKGTAVRKIARLLKISRNTVRQVLRQPQAPPPAQPRIPPHLLPVVCRGIWDPHPTVIGNGKPRKVLGIRGGAVPSVSCG